jgi:hypothetical protein
MTTQQHSRALETFLAAVFLAGIIVVGYSIHDKINRTQAQETVCFKFSDMRLRQ